MSEPTGGAGFRPPSLSTQVTHLQAQQGQAARRRKQLTHFGTPASGDQFSRMVQEYTPLLEGVSGNNSLRNPKAQQLYGSNSAKKERAAPNPFAQELPKLFGQGQQLDWYARQDFGQNSDSQASLT